MPKHEPIIMIIIIRLTHYLFSDWQKAYSEFPKSALLILSTSSYIKAADSEIFKLVSKIKKNKIKCKVSGLQPRELTCTQCGDCLNHSNYSLYLKILNKGPKERILEGNSRTFFLISTVG